MYGRRQRLPRRDRLGGDVHTMFRSALVHTALGTEEARLVLGLAEGLRALGVGRVVLANVIDASGLEGPVIAEKVDAVLEGLREACAPLEAAGMKVECRVPTGSDASSELLALAAEAHVDMVVSGSHRKSQMDRLFAGSVSEMLAAHSPVPSLVARFDLIGGSERPAELLRAFPRALVMPTDFSDAAERAVTTVLSLPPESVGEILFLHVTDPSLSGDALRRQTDGASFQLENLVARARGRGLGASWAVEPGGIIETVLAEVEARSAAGVVVGRRAHAVLQETLLGSLLLTLLREAPVPVLVVP
ncbi:MAG: hypothetical protein C0418_06090 [Coriobacteriaceae bacterium]|nr:hypothetical protein [Coriobacteriaceae bacterium]